MSKRKMLCPACGVAVFWVWNNKGERIPVYVDEEGKVTPKQEGTDLTGADTNTVHCMGCSWKGAPKKQSRP